MQVGIQTVLVRQNGVERGCSLDVVAAIAHVPVASAFVDLAVNERGWILCSHALEIACCIGSALNQVSSASLTCGPIAPRWRCHPMMAASFGRAPGEPGGRSISASRRRCHP